MMIREFSARARLFAISIVMVVAASIAAPAHAQDSEIRRALVIGNAKYLNVDTLDNPLNDVAIVSDALSRLDLKFEVKTVENLPADEMRREIIEFGEELANLKSLNPSSKVVGLIYYAGHGVQSDGKNFLLPIDADVSSAISLLPAPTLEFVNSVLSYAGNDLNIVVLDACRNELRLPTRPPTGDRGIAPVPSFTRPAKGLQNIVYFYSTEAGALASDGDGDNSPFAEAFSKHLFSREEIALASRRVEIDVFEATRGRQDPDLYTDIKTFFYFNPAGGANSNASLSGNSVVALAEPFQTQDRIRGILNTADGIQKNTFKDCDACPEMVEIPSGAFFMGSPDTESGRDNDEGPQREVSISRFAAGVYEVTWDEWEACVSEGACEELADLRGWGKGRRPVIGVNWRQVQDYLAWLNQKVDGWPYRLLTEAEWEYAARAGTTGPFWFGEISSEKANYDSTYSYNGSQTSPRVGRTTPVGSYKANPFGLYDVHGNVREFVQDCHSDYSEAPTDGSAAKTGDNCFLRALRGGTWAVPAAKSRSAHRRHTTFNGGYGRAQRGFRVARDLDE